MARTSKARTPGERARAIRRSLGLTIQGAASKAGMGTGALCDFENGKRNLRTDTLLKLAAFLGVKPSALLDSDGPPRRAA